MDAYAVGLRVLRDGQYWQYFLCKVDGLDADLHRGGRVPEDNWWRAVVQVGIDEIQRQAAVVRPKEPPTQAVAVHISGAAIARHLASRGPLPELEEGTFGHPVGSFEGPSPT